MQAGAYQAKTQYDPAWLAHSESCSLLTKPSLVKSSVKWQDLDKFYPNLLLGTNSKYLGSAPAA